MIGRLTLAAMAATLVTMAACVMYSKPAATYRHPDVLLLASTDGSFGSGVIVADRWVLTVDHLGDVVGQTVRIVHPTLDMALVRIENVRGGIAAGAPPRLHDRLFAYGWHLGRFFLMTEGRQGALPGEMSAPIIHGCSGGPVVNELGQLVGIVDHVTYIWTERGFDGYALPHLSGYTPVDRKVVDWIRKVIAQ